MKKTVRLNRRRGANSIEYLILVGVVALGALGAFTLFGKSVSQRVRKFSSCPDDTCIPH